MNLLDIILLVILIVFFFWGFKRGFLLTFLQLLGIILVIILVRQFGVLLRDGIHLRLGIPQIWVIIFGYAIIFIVIMLLAKIISSLLQSFIGMIKLGWLDRVLGGVFNIVFCFALMVIIVMILEVSSISAHIGEYRHSSQIYSSARIIAEDIISKYLDGIPGSQPSRERHERYRGRRLV